MRQGKIMIMGNFNLYYLECNEISSYNLRIFSQRKFIIIIIIAQKINLHDKRRRLSRATCAPSSYEFQCADKRFVCAKNDIISDDSIYMYK